MWGKRGEYRKIAWVRWREVCCPKSHGVKDLRLFKEALLAKWRWNLFHQPNTLWGAILKAKYGGMVGGGIYCM